MEIARTTPHDAAAVEALLRAAFDGQDEADLVVALRRAGAIFGEWVAVMGSEVVGHVALSRMVAPEGWLCLAPLAVQPERQGQGIGTALARRAASEAGAATAVVLGEPGFYARAGFDTARAAALRAPYPLEYLSILRPGDDVPQARLVYPEAFG